MRSVKLCLMILFFVAFFGCKKKEVLTQQEVIRPVKFEKVTYFDGRKVVKLSCAIEPKSAQNLSFKTSGKIIELAIKPGDFINKGDLVAVLDDQTQKLNVQEAIALVAKEKAQLDSATLNYNQMKSLYENDNVSLSQFQQSQTQFQASKSGLISAQKRLEKANIELENTKLLASVSAVVADVYKDINESISVGQSLAMIYSNNDVVARLNLPDNIINKVKIGSSVELFFPNSENKNYIGEISEISISGSSSSLTYPAKVRIKNVDESLKVSMTGNASIFLGKADSSKQIIVPINAVSKDTTKAFVYILDNVEENMARVKKVYVKLGSISNEGIEVLEGLTTQDLLITAGVSKIIEGQTVKVEF